MYKGGYASIERRYADQIGLSRYGQRAIINVRLTEIIKVVKNCLQAQVIPPLFEIIYKTEYILLKDGWYEAINGIHYEFKGGYFYGSNPFRYVTGRKWGTMQLFVPNEKPLEECRIKIICRAR